MSLIELVVVVLLVILLVGPGRSRLGAGRPYYDPIMFLLIIILGLFLFRGVLYLPVR